MSHFKKEKKEIWVPTCGIPEFQSGNVQLNVINIKELHGHKMYAIIWQFISKN